jgi:phosphate transport system protein
MTEHTIKAFDTDLDVLSRMIADMGGLAEKQTADAVNALIRRDVALAHRANDIKIVCFKLKSKNAPSSHRTAPPMALDLREISARCAFQRSRVGDLACRTLQSASMR